jgi:hypothetical protein
MESEASVISQEDRLLLSRVGAISSTRRSRPPPPILIWQAHIKILIFERQLITLFLSHSQIISEKSDLEVFDVNKDALSFKLKTFNVLKVLIA